MKAPSSKSARPAPARILIVDDHPMVREGFIRLVGQQRDMVCCGEVGTAAQAQSTVAKERPDLVITDLRLKGGDGLDLIKSLRAECPQMRILVLSQHAEPLYVERALRAGAAGFVAKEQPPGELLNAIRTVLAGELYLTRAMAALFLNKFVGREAPAGHPRREADLLTDRELQVLQLLGGGLSTREIGVRLSVSFKTVESHRENLKRKLRLKDGTKLVHYASEWAQERLPSPSATTAAQSASARTLRRRGSPGHPPRQ